MSAVAKYLYKKGYDVSGSDSTHTDIIAHLEEKYGFIYAGDHHPDNLHSNVNLVVYTPAVGPGNVEYDKALTLGLDMHSYPEYLGIISKEKKTIAISGTNGKTTTTTMTAEVLINLELEPTVIVGGVMKAFDTNYIDGNSDLFVVEACEYKNSFLSLTPDVLVLTNITPDHLDFFGTYENYKEVFIKLINNMESGSSLICNEHDSELQDVVEVAKSKGIQVLDYMTIPEPKLKIPGDHNVMNAQAALAVAHALGADVQQAGEYLQESFEGSKRRFEHVGETEAGISVYDDYAHNPEALVTLIQGLKEQDPDRAVILFFQPHLYSRTKDLFGEFTQALILADQVILLPIYAAREIDDSEMSSIILSEGMKLLEPECSVDVVSDFEEAVEVFESYKLPKKNIVITAGAGDIYKLSVMLVQ